MTYSIATLCGSLRRGSVNAQLLRAAEDTAPADWRFEHLSGLEDLPHYSQDIEEQDGFPGPVEHLAKALRSADGLIIASPEYNYGVTGVLKNAIDWLSRVDDQPFEGLPVSLMSASPSPMGGIRAQYPLRQIFVALQADVMQRPEVAVAFAYERFEENRLVHEPTRDVLRKHLNAFEALITRRSAHRAKAA
ncbi:MAG: NADPH-dependent FMN reductase [Pseudomonadota bacterium]